MSEEQAPTDEQEEPREGDKTTAIEPLSLPDDQSMTASELDALFETLANRERRLVLTYLVDADDSVATFPDLIDHVVGDAATDDARERLAIQLHHTHLPKLCDRGLVEYDVRSETVRYRGSRTITEWVNATRQ